MHPTTQSYKISLLILKKWSHVYIQTLTYAVTLNKLVNGDSSARFSTAWDKNVVLCVYSFFDANVYKQPEGFVFTPLCILSIMHTKMHNMSMRLQWRDRRLLQLSRCQSIRHYSGETGETESAFTVAVN